MRCLLAIEAILVAWALAGVGLGAESSDVPTSLVKEEIVGVALRPDGVTPIGDLPVRLWSVDRQEMIYRTRTKPDGSFRIPTLRSEHYYIFVGRVRVNLKMIAADDEAEWHQYHDLIVILPNRILVSASPLVSDLIIALPTRILVGASPSVSDVIIAPLIVPVVPRPPSVVSP